MKTAREVAQEIYDSPEWFGGDTSGDDNSPEPVLQMLSKAISEARREGAEARTQRDVAHRELNEIRAVFGLRPDEPIPGGGLAGLVKSSRMTLADQRDAALKERDEAVEERNLLLDSVAKMAGPGRMPFDGWDKELRAEVERLREVFRACRTETDIFQSAEPLPVAVRALRERAERSGADVRGWLAANGPGGWVDALRRENAELRRVMDRCSAIIGSRLDKDTVHAAYEVKQLLDDAIARPAEQAAPEASFEKV